MSERTLSYSGGAISFILETRTAENSAAYLLGELQSMKERNPHLKILDVGTGPGTISVGFARNIPDGHVTATDLNPDVLKRAQEIASASGVGNIEFQTADIHKLPFPDETFDITHCHQVLTHIKNPWDAIREMLRVTKPGGIVAARESDIETQTVWPDSPGIVKSHQWVKAMMAHNGGSPTAGRQLLSWALKAGAERDQITHSFGTLWYSTDEEAHNWTRATVSQIYHGRAREGVEFITEQDFDEMAKAWEEWSDKDGGSLAMLQGQILIRK
ncbi:methylase [Xylaria telfairii]|nr:methylase [Xylaria telfairii]